MVTYAGDVSAADAFVFLNENDKSVLVDVRSPNEMLIFGEPDISQSGKKVLQISWLSPETMSKNPNFDILLTSNVPNKDSNVFFLCKVGGRSAMAAQTAASLGYSKCYNIINGMEEGWKPAGLPWRVAQ